MQKIQYCHKFLLVFKHVCLLSLTALTKNIPPHKSAVRMSPMLFCVDVLITQYF